MNLNNLRADLKNQINHAVRSGLTVEGTTEILGSELSALLKRLEIMERVPFPTIIDGITPKEMEQYISLYQEMVERWYEKTADVFQIVNELEQLRFEEVASRTALVTRLLDLATTVHTHTRSAWREFMAVLGFSDKSWKERIEKVTVENKEQSEEEVTDRTMAAAQ